MRTEEQQEQKNDNLYNENFFVPVTVVEHFFPSPSDLKSHKLYQSQKTEHSFSDNISDRTTTRTKKKDNLHNKTIVVRTKLFLIS